MNTLTHREAEVARLLVDPRELTIVAISGMLYVSSKTGSTLDAHQGKDRCAVAARPLPMDGRSGMITLLCDDDGILVGTGIEPSPNWPRGTQVAKSAPPARPDAYFVIPPVEGGVANGELHTVRPSLGLLNKAVRKRDGVCRLCGLPGDEVDHIRERSRNGADCMENLQLLCFRCHTFKTRYPSWWPQNSEQMALFRKTLDYFFPEWRCAVS